MRTLYGGRISLLVGIVATAVSLVIGVDLRRGRRLLSAAALDALMMRIVDILYALPFMFFVILLMVFFGRNIVLIFVAIGAINWLDMARIVRGQTLSLKHREFVEAAQAQGVPPLAIIRRHIVPNLLGVVAVYVTLTIPQVILVESFLSFLGLGVQEPMTSWGALVNDGAPRARDARRGCSCSPPRSSRRRCSASTSSATAARRARSEGPLADERCSKSRSSNVRFATPDGEVHAVARSRASRSQQGETLGIVGESGSRQEPNGAGLARPARGERPRDAAARASSGRDLLALPASASGARSAAARSR